MMSMEKNFRENRPGGEDRKPKEHKIVVMGEGGVGKSGKHSMFICKYN